MKCVSKKQYECIKLTKENLKEFLRIVEPYLDSKYVFIQDDNDKYCLVKRFEVEKYYFTMSGMFSIGTKQRGKYIQTKNLKKNLN